MNRHLRAFIGTIAGLFMMGGALQAWQEYHVDGVVAVVFAASGAYLIWYVLEAKQ